MNEIVDLTNSFLSLYFIPHIVFNYCLT